MEFYNSSLSTGQPSSLDEINKQLKRRYLDRLGQRVRKLRKLMVGRNWTEIRMECNHLVVSGQTFNFPHLTELAADAQKAIPNGKVPPAATPVDAPERIRALIKGLDQILMDDSGFHS